MIRSGRKDIRGRGIKRQSLISTLLFFITEKKDFLDEKFK